MPSDLLGDDEIAAALQGLSQEWSRSGESLKRSIEFADSATAEEFVSRLAPICDELDHHADLALRWRWVDIELTTHSAKGVTELDVRLARQIDELAALLPVAGQTG